MGVCLVSIVLRKFLHLMQKSGDPDRSAESDLGLPCLPISLLWDTMHINVLMSFYILSGGFV